MTQKNINTMDVIVDFMTNGAKLSEALKHVYSKRNVAVPFNDEMLDVDIKSLKMTARTTNALLRARLKTIKDVVEYCQCDKITNISNLGNNSGKEVFERILDYCWDHMSKNEKTKFLIDTVERNAEFVCI